MSTPHSHAAKKRKINEVEVDPSGSSVPTPALIADSSRMTASNLLDRHALDMIALDDQKRLLSAIERTDAKNLKDYILAKIRGVMMSTLAPVQSQSNQEVTSGGERAADGHMMEVDMNEGENPSSVASHQHKIELPSPRQAVDSSASTHLRSATASGAGPTSLPISTDRATGPSTARERPSYKGISKPAQTATSIATAADVSTFPSTASTELQRALTLLFQQLVAEGSLPPALQQAPPSQPASAAVDSPSIIIVPAANLSEMPAAGHATPPTRPGRSSRAISAPPQTSPPSGPRLAEPSKTVPPSPPREDDEELHCTRCHQDYTLRQNRSPAGIPGPCVIEHDWESRESHTSSGGTIWRYRCCGYDFQSASGDVNPTDPNANTDTGTYCFVGDHTTNSKPEVTNNMNTWTCQELGCWEDETDE